MKRIIISRTDSIGDVMLTLPLAVALRQKFPGAYIIFLGRTYTEPVIRCCSAVDEFADWDEIQHSVEKMRSLNADVILHVFPRSNIASMARRAGTPLRIGTSHRLYHFLTCNKLINLGRKSSDLHEAQLNLKLGVALGLKEDFSIDELKEMNLLDKIPVLGEDGLINKSRRNIILHPSSRGSAREWHPDNFSALIRSLPADKFKIFISGTKEEGEDLKAFIHAHSGVTDITGKHDLSQFISFISRCDALVAASTGPLHIAAALGIKAIGIFPPMRPIHKERWGPIGKKALALSVDKSCSDCRKSGDCACMRLVSSESITKELLLLL